MTYLQKSKGTYTFSKGNFSIPSACKQQENLSAIYIYASIYNKAVFVPHITGTRLGRIPTDAEQATGLERKEYEAMAAGIEVRQY